MTWKVSWSIETMMPGVRRDRMAGLCVAGPKFMQSGTNDCEVPAERHFKFPPALKEDHRIGYFKPRLLGQGQQKLLNRAPAAGGLAILYFHNNNELQLIIRQDVFDPLVRDAYFLVSVTSVPTDPSWLPTKNPIMVLPSALS